MRVVQVREVVDEKKREWNLFINSPFSRYSVTPREYSTFFDSFFRNES